LAGHKDSAIQLRDSEGDSDRKYFEAIFRFILRCSLVWNYSFDIFHEWMVETFSNLPGNGFPGWEEILVPECVHANGNKLWKLLDRGRESGWDSPVCAFSIQNWTSPSVRPLAGCFNEGEAVSFFL
jgi:hypothetical protein